MVRKLSVFVTCFFALFAVSAPSIGAELTTVRIASFAQPQVGVPWNVEAAYYYAAERGVFAKYGIKVEFKQILGTGNHLKLFARGEVDMSTATTVAFRCQKPVGKPCMLATTFARRQPIALIAWKDVTKEILDGKLIGIYRCIKGKPSGVGGSLLMSYFRAHDSKLKLSCGDTRKKGQVTFFAIGGENIARASVLLNREVDAFVWSGISPAVSAFLVDKRFHIALGPKDMTATLTGPAMTREYYEKNRETVARVVAAVKEVITTWQRNPQTLYAYLASKRFAPRTDINGNPLSRGTQKQIAKISGDMLLASYDVTKVTTETSIQKYMSSYFLMPPGKLFPLEKVRAVYSQTEAQKLLNGAYLPK